MTINLYQNTFMTFYFYNIFALSLLSEVLEIK